MRSSQGALEIQQTQIMHSYIPWGCTQPAPRSPNASWENAHKAGEGKQMRHDASYADEWITEISNAAGHPRPEKHWQVIPVSIPTLVYWRRGWLFAYLQWIHVWQWHGLPDQCVQSNPWWRLAKSLCDDMAHALQLCIEQDLSIHTELTLKTP